MRWWLPVSIAPLREGRPIHPKGAAMASALKWIEMFQSHRCVKADRSRCHHLLYWQSFRLQGFNRTAA